MPQICRPAKCIEAVRVALIGECCGPTIPGPLNGYVMGCVIDPNWTPEIEEGEESLVKDNCGDICLRDDRCDIVKRWNLEFKIKNPDPEFVALISGDNRILNLAQDLTVGVQHVARQCSPYLFVEFFERTDDCTTGTPVYFRHVFPCVRLVWTGNEREGIFRILQIEGKTNEVLLSEVGVGPYGDIPANAIFAPPGTRADYFWFEDVTVPAISCGAVEVPVGELPTPIVDCVDLLTAGSYGVLAGSTITNVPTSATVIDGDLGLDPGSSVTGFPLGVVTGTTHINDAQAIQAKTDLVAAYLDAEGRTSDYALSADIGGQTLGPGVYTTDGSPASLGITGTVTLDAGGDPDARWLFQIESTLTTAPGSIVALTNGAQACNVFWQVGSSATLDTTSEFAGTILALASITANTGANVAGRLLARNGAVTLDENLVTVPTCESQCNQPALPTPLTDGQLMTNGYSDGGTIWEVFLSAADGSSDVNYGLPAGWTYNLAWHSISADRTAYLIVGEGPGGTNQLASLRYAADNVLIHEFDVGLVNSGTFSRYAALAPDLSAIAYQVQVGSGVLPRIETLDQAGTRVVIASGDSVDPPAYSPDGTMLAYSRNIAGDNYIEVSASDGSGLISQSPIVGVSGIFAQGRIMWSPDSTLVYFITDEGVTYPDVALLSMVAATGVVATIGTIPSIAALDPPAVWDLSPDGTVAVIMRRDTANSYQIWTMLISSGVLTQRTTSINSGFSTPSISISPDGLSSVSGYANGSNGASENALAISDLTAGAPVAPFTFTQTGDDTTRSIFNVVWRGVPAP